MKSETGNLRLIWLEEGKLDSATLESSTWIEDKGGSGWIHAEHNHILKPGDNQFEKAFGSDYAISNPNYEKNAQELIMKASKEGVETVNTDGSTWRVYTEPTTGKPLSVLIGDNGYIVTARPGLL